jgi:hypothetical protein
VSALEQVVKPVPTKGGGSWNSSHRRYRLHINRLLLSSFGQLVIGGFPAINHTSIHLLASGLKRKE